MVHHSQMKKPEPTYWVRGKHNIIHTQQTIEVRYAPAGKKHDPRQNNKQTQYKVHCYERSACVNALCLSEYSTCERNKQLISQPVCENDLLVSLLNLRRTNIILTLNYNYSE